MVGYRDVLAVNRCANGDAHTIVVADVLKGCRESNFDVLICRNVTFPAGGDGGAFVGSFGDSCADAGDGGDQECCL